MLWKSSPPNIESFQAQCTLLCVCVCVLFFVVINLFFSFNCNLCKHIYDIDTRLLLNYHVFNLSFIYSTLMVCFKAGFLLQDYKVLWT